MYLADIYTVFANLTGIPGIALPLFLPRAAGIGGGQYQGVVPDGPTVEPIRSEGDSGQRGGGERRGGLPRAGIVR